MHFDFFVHTDISTSIFNTSCLLSTCGGYMCFSLQWFPTQYSVNQWYNVTVTPDPFFCSSDQVSPSEDDYICSGLDLETNYTITVGAINCGHQERENDMIYTISEQNSGLFSRECASMHSL